MTATALVALSAHSAYPLEWEATTTVNAGSRTFAPYYIMSNRDGRLSQAYGAQESAGLWRPLDLSRRFSYSFGVEAVAGMASDADYVRYNESAGAWYENARHPASFWLQQLWGEVKYRGVFLSVGMRDNDRSIFDSPLYSGDITLSDNARGIPQVRAGFIDFQDIPLTRGWVQIKREIAYGKLMDNNLLENHYNYYNSFITTDVWMHYKRLYLRTNPQQPFSVTVGMQHAVQFGGHRRVYQKGKCIDDRTFSHGFKEFVNVFLPNQGSGTDDNYYQGNHLGSWDIILRYRFPSGGELRATVQKPWEDGSGIGWLNGFDGVWGLEYRAPQPGWLTAAAVQYVDFTNHSGLVHWDPGDFSGTPVGGEATGADNYYNNATYDGWSNLGMGLGNPFIKSPIYNTDGYLRFTDNRLRGFQAGVEGTPMAGLNYRVLLSWRKSWGTPFEPRIHKAESTSMMIEAEHVFHAVPALSIKGQVAFDAGKLYGNRFGMAVSLTYKGRLAL